MERQLLHPENSAFQSEWDPEDIRTTFCKCVRWQVEETMDPINCPYHYFCDSTYPGNYPPPVDIVVIIFTAASYVATLVLMVTRLSGRGRASFGHSKRFFIPSGPVSLPTIVLALAKGHRINTIFPLSSIGPAILLLVYISALTFDNGVDKDIKYAIFEASTISGILQASLFMDSVVLPYYTGFDALVSSTFSGECMSCVCRKEALVVGGKLVSYRGRSVTTVLVVAALCLRVICRLSEESKRKIRPIKPLLEGLGWILITMDCVYLVKYSPPELFMLRVATFGSIFLLICLHTVTEACTQIIKWHSSCLK
ncbi:hypothetical protein CFOL_v3_16984 [Cephalotus follicularis]|uniref:Uncharacterized protein n=1 Tax=Cephalotus follicularis TaxID=3775 RepID=A0A1Q3C035_CEPFO|nr:hypothetical protein CFOL_v3_16984 [Cephalotus follicularis]